MILTEAEIRVVQLVLMAYSNKEIAAGLGIAENTVKHHLAQIYDRCGLNENEDTSRSRVRLLQFLHTNRFLLGVRCLACDG